VTTRCLCLSLSAHSTGVLSDVDLMVPMMGVSADSREDPAPRRGFRRPGRGAGGWGPGIAHVALGRRVKARASSRAGLAVYPPGKDLSSRAEPRIRRGLERGGKGPRIRPTGHRGAQERGPVLGFRPGPVLPSMGQQESMQPETVASCLVATEHRSILRQAESSLGSLDLQDQAQSAAGGDRLEPGLLAQPDGEGQLPIAGRPGPSR